MNEIEKIKNKLLEEVIQTFTQLQKQDFNYKEIYQSLNMSEQTFFSWKKKNPEAFQALVDGYKHKVIVKKLEKLCVLTAADEIISKSKMS